MSNGKGRFWWAGRVGDIVGDAEADADAEAKAKLYGVRNAQTLANTNAKGSKMSAR